MKLIVLCIVFICIFLFHTSAHAQTYPCPDPGPDDVVVGQTDAGNGVASVQLCARASNQSRTPSVEWVSRWGAIATDEPNGVVGSATGLANQPDAEREALSDCRIKGGKNCLLQLPYANGCAALVVGDSVFNVSADITAEIASNKGIQKCKKDSTNCRVFFTACSLPERVQ